MKQEVVLISSADNAWGIGKDNRLLYSVPEDLRRFRELTTGNTIIYGRKTLESFPKGAPLRDRRNIVVSSGYVSDRPDLLVARTPEDALRLALENDPYKTRTVFVCGGASIYRQLLPYCHAAYITRFDAETEGADARLPNLDLEDGWSKTSWTGWKESVTGIRYSYVIYRHNPEQVKQIPG